MLYTVHVYSQRTGDRCFSCRGLTNTVMPAPGSLGTQFKIATTWPTCLTLATTVMPASGSLGTQVKIAITWPTCLTLETTVMPAPGSLGTQVKKVITWPTCLILATTVMPALGCLGTQVVSHYLTYLSKFRNYYFSCSCTTGNTGDKPLPGLPV